MKRETKLAMRRFALRWLRKLVDVADDRCTPPKSNFETLSLTCGIGSILPAQS